MTTVALFFFTSFMFWGQSGRRDKILLGAVGLECGPCLTPSYCMLFPRWHENYHWLQLMMSGRKHGILNLSPSLIVFCPHLNQLESSVYSGLQCFLSIPCTKILLIGELFTTGGFCKFFFDPAVTLGSMSNLFELHFMFTLTSAIPSSCSA